MTAGYTVESIRRSFADFASQKAAFECAKEQAEQVFARSKTIDITESYPKFTLNEIKLGKKLGQGSFGIVYECHEFAAAKRPSFTKEESSLSLTSDITATTAWDREGKPTVVDSSLYIRTSRHLSFKKVKADSFRSINFLSTSVRSRNFLSMNCFREGGRPRYAVKMLQEDIARNPAMLTRASIDMAVESQILSSVRHPNIIKMHACGASPYKADYFIVIDRLYDTLDQRIAKWAQKEKYIKSSIGKIIFRKKMKSIMEDKLMTALDLAAAFEYLHSKNIIYRDLKPDNVGFDSHDDVKLFDFGFAMEVHLEDKDDNGNFLLTSMTGSPLYMAPEVALGNRYSFSCDVYSFGLLMWHMCESKEPFMLYRMKDMKERVWSGELKRPEVKGDWSLNIVKLLKSSWSHDAAKRPSFQQIYKVLEEQCTQSIDEYDTAVELLEIR